MGLPITIQQCIRCALHSSRAKHAQQLFMGTSNCLTVHRLNTLCSWHWSDASVCLTASASNRLHKRQPLHMYIYSVTKGVHLTMAFRLAILRVPRARQVVMTAGRPSGMAATASATAILK